MAEERNIHAMNTQRLSVGSNSTINVPPDLVQDTSCTRFETDNILSTDKNISYKTIDIKVSDTSNNISDMSKNKQGCLKIRKMYLAAFVALLAALCNGMVYGYSAPATYDMVNRNDSRLKPTPDDVSWIGSIAAIGSIFGGLIAGPVADKIGRKGTTLVSLVDLLVGWIMIFLAKNTTLILIGRFLCGIAQGMISLAVTIYCVEIASSEVRGSLGSGFLFFLVFGNLMSAIIGAYVSWEMLAMISGIITIISFICLLPAPESPRWLVAKGNTNSAAKVLKYLHGTFLNSEEECRKIEKECDQQPKGLLTWKEIKHPYFYKPALICMSLMFFQQLGGFPAVQYFSTFIFDSTKNVLDPKISTVLLIFVRLMGAFCMNFLVDKAGRKTLLILSGFLSSVCLFVFGTFYQISESNPGFKENFAAIPFVSIMLFIFTYSLGFSSIPWLLSAELTAVRARSTMGSVASLTNGLFTFVGSKTFENMSSNLGAATTFWIYAGVSFVSCIFVILFVPETKGKDAAEIQKYFHDDDVSPDVTVNSFKMLGN